MRKLLILSLVTLPILSFGQDFDTKAKYAYLIDADTNFILFDKNSNDKMYPASMTKLMTAYIVFDYLKTGKIKLEDTFTTSNKAWKAEGSRMFLPLGEQAKVQDLLKGLIIQSGNDAAISLAENLMGSEESFAKVMNITAKKIGLNNSNYLNATGLPDVNHYTTCRDLGILALRSIRDFPEYYPYYAEKEFTYNKITQPNRNRLMNYDIGVDGLKTGHTNIAGYGIVASALKNGRRLIAVTSGLNSENERISETEKLLKYGFANFHNVEIAKKDQKFQEIEVKLGKIKKISPASEKDIILTVPSYLSNQLIVTINYQTPLEAPISKGQKIAEIKVTGLEKNQELIFPLTSPIDIEKANWFGLFIEKIKTYLFK